MKKLNLVLASADREYAELFMHYVQSSEFVHDVMMKSFTQLESFRYYVQHEPSVDLILAEEAFLAGDSTANCACPILILSEDTRGLGAAEAGKKIGKYQPLHVLLSSLLLRYGGERISSSANGGNAGRTKVISVYSSAAGMGKTTLALNLCKQLTLQGQRVFYLSLEMLNGSALIMESSRSPQAVDSDNRLSKLLYYLKAGRRMEELLAEWNGMKSRGPAMSFDYFEPLHNLDEMKQLNKADTCQLLDLILQTGAYDTVVMDLDSALEERTLAALERSDQLFWLIQDDALALWKTEQVLQYLELHQSSQEVSALLHKTCFTVNRFVGQMVNAVRSPRIRVGAYLPYIAAWKQIEQPHVLLQAASFQSAVMKLCADEGIMQHG
ncbi:AAA family ATPase [Paenibacillus terrigena]|uniref:AAA family ATPase n=1 Tax=Paenibacillus terrigena TaxID=369333 RepID=UPI00036CD7B7|nr:AAA family ATPase [Paenibacillus terrigena]